MKNFLITGALGFIFSNVTNYLSLKYPHIKIYILDKKDYCSSIENINKESLHNTEIIIGDIRNKELVSFILNKYDITNVIHAAAETHVDNSFFNSTSFTENNILGTHILLECCKIYQEKTGKLEQFIHVSTDEVYGEVLNNEIKLETSVLNPTNPYAASKCGAEFLVKSYYYSYKLPIIITRGNNVYGMNQYPEKVIPKFICHLLNGQKVTIQGDGSNRRNFIHIDDVCTAFETILLKGKIGNIYNISGPEDNDYSVIDLTKILLKLFNPEIDTSNEKELLNSIKYVEDRKFNDYRYYISGKKLEELGWKAKKNNLEQNLKELIEWYKLNKSRYGF